MKNFPHNHSAIFIDVGSESPEDPTMAYPPSLWIIAIQACLLLHIKFKGRLGTILSVLRLYICEGMVCFDRFDYWIWETND